AGHSVTPKGPPLPQKREPSGPPPGASRLRLRPQPARRPKTPVQNRRALTDPVLRKGIQGRYSNSSPDPLEDERPGNTSPGPFVVGVRPASVSRPASPGRRPRGPTSARGRG